MKLNKLFALAVTLILLATFSVPAAMADQWNQATKVTFSAQVELPGTILLPGTYWFTLLNGDTDRNIVQIWGANRMHLLATILTIPDYRLHPKGKTVIKFEERPSSQPEALQAWFYPGDSYGYEFVYPEHRARELAKRIGQPVLSMPDSLATNISKPAKSADEPSVAAMKNAHVEAVNPKGENVSVAQAAQENAQK